MQNEYDLMYIEWNKKSNNSLNIDALFSYKSKTLIIRYKDHAL